RLALVAPWRAGLPPGVPSDAAGGAQPAFAPARAFFARQGRGLLDRPLRAAARVVLGGVRRWLHGRSREAAVPMDPRGRGPRGCRARRGEPAGAGLAAAGR